MMADMAESNLHGARLRHGGHSFRVTLNPLIVNSRVRAVPLELEHDEAMVLGRGSVTRVKDLKCSRHQVKVTCDLHDGKVFVEQLGTSSSAIGSGKLVRGQKYCITDSGTKLYLLASNRDETAYEVCIERTGADTTQTVDFDDSSIRPEAVGPELKSLGSADLFGEPFRAGPESVGQDLKSNASSSAPASVMLGGGGDSRGLAMPSEPSDAVMPPDASLADGADGRAREHVQRHSTTAAGASPGMTGVLEASLPGEDGEKLSPIPYETPGSCIGGGGGGGGGGEREAKRRRRNSLPPTRHDHLTPRPAHGRPPRACSPVVASALAPLPEGGNRHGDRTPSPAPLKPPVSPIVAAALAGGDRSPGYAGRDVFGDDSDVDEDGGGRGRAAAAASPRKGYTSHWKHALEDVISNPKRYKEDIVFEDKHTLVIRDKYPKARQHFLILPRQLVANLSELTREHLPLLEKMQRTAAHMIHRQQKLGFTTPFQTGFHAIPSMRQLHMHVISRDFDSPCMKNKKHWNSFTTKYFVGSRGAFDLLKEEGQIRFCRSEYEPLLKKPLVCHICHEPQRNMPILKRHILDHI